MDDWEKYEDNKKYREINGVKIIVPDKDIEITPVECPVCRLLMSTQPDIDAYKNHQCCYMCERRWVFGGKMEEWNSGWRPTHQEVLDEIDKRNSGMSNIFIGNGDRSSQ